MISSTRARSSLGQLVRSLARPALCVEVDDRLVRVRQHLRPPALVEHLDPVEQIELAVAQPLGEHAHDRALQRPRARQARGGRACSRAARRRGRRAASAPGASSSQQLAEARDGVVGREELREHVAAADGSGEDDAVLRRGAGQLGERRRRAHHLERAALDDLLDAARDGDRERELAAVAVRARAGAGRAAASARAAPRAPARRPGRAARPRGRRRRRGRRRSRRPGASPGRATPAARRRSRGLSEANACALTASTPERAEHERQHERGRRAAVVDDDAEARARGRRRRRAPASRSCGVALAHARRVGDAADRPRTRRGAAPGA